MKNHQTRVICHMSVHAWDIAVIWQPLKAFSWTVFISFYFTKRTGGVVFVHSVKVIEHFYIVNDASAVFSNWNIWIAKLNSAVQRLKELKEKYPDLEKFAVHYNFARCLEMGTVGQGRKPYNTYSIIWVSSISSTVLNRWSFVEHSWTMYTPGQEGGR